MRTVRSLAWGIFLAVLLVPKAGGQEIASASTSAPGYGPAGARDGQRFDCSKSSCWQGNSNERSWWWQVQFTKPCTMGAILQINGDHPLVFRNAPKNYVWQLSNDGENWRDLTETVVKNESRMFRIHRLK